MVKPDVLRDNPELGMALTDVRYEIMLTMESSAEVRSHMGKAQGIDQAAYEA
ncbi:MAG: hypothetical protein OXD01_10535 [Gammaproteobacteria bacterium]|nr:hypothetical protein [Gammaproteobacteria bacterium]